MKKFIPAILCFLMTCSSAQDILAQDTAKLKAPVTTAPAPVADPSLRGQYNLMLAKSKTLNGYKLINPFRLSSFYKSVNDSLRTNIVLLKNAKAKIRTQEASIKELNDQIKGKESALEDTNSKMDEISFLGISFSKSAYNGVVWSIIVLLALGFTFVTIRSAKSIQEAKYRSNLYEEIAQEYQAYKVKANDKEKKLARELQDERNKLDDYKNRQ